MHKIQRTNVSSLEIRQKVIWDADSSESSTTYWETIPDLPPKRSLLKNTAVASALVLCAVTLRTGVLPSLNNATDVILTAATDQSLLDNQLGKLSFVSALFPEAILVFGESRTPQIAMPVSGGMIVHAWSENEPYTTFRTSTQQILSSVAGEVTGIYHGCGEERLVQIANDEGLACIYGNLKEITVQIGDAVTVGEEIGTLIPGEDLVFELRQEGRSINPASCFVQ